MLPESAREAIRGNGMDFMRLQLRAAATAFGIFAVASLLLLLLVRGVGNIAAVLPFPRHLPSYSPAETLAALLDLRPLVAFGAGVLLAAAFVLIIRSQFLDRAVYMLVSMLTLILASSLGIAAGFAVYLFAVDRRIMVPEGIVPDSPAFVIHRDFIGDVRRANGDHPLLFAKLDTRGVGVIAGRMEPGHVSERHRHTHEAVMIIIEGNGYSEVEGEKVQWKAGVWWREAGAESPQ